MAYLLLEESKFHSPSSTEFSLLELKYSYLIQAPNSIQPTAPIQKMFPYYSQVCLYQWSQLGMKLPSTGHQVMSEDNLVVTLRGGHAAGI